MIVSCYTYLGFHRTALAKWTPLLALSVVVLALAPSCSSTPHAGPSESQDGSKDIDISVYDFLHPSDDLDYAETPGYGLYSYVFLFHASSRSEEFIRYLVQKTLFAPPQTIAKQRQNVIYLPTKNGKVRSTGLTKGREPIRKFLNDQYDFAYANSRLGMICDHRAEHLAQLCDSDYTSGGPYLFTYSEPISGRVELPPPYLFLDLSTVSSAAFPEFIYAYKTQVMRPHYTDYEELATFRLDVLRILTSASDHTRPIIEAVLHLVKSGS